MSNGGPGSSRWNPTKEQITMLEGLYGQGIRTPSAEQIQQITSRLRAYGHIEGKNVFYWFQNHKARQRQKQKQESMVYVNRFFHKAAPVLVPSPPASCNNVVCSPFYIPNGGVGFCPHYPRLLLPGGIRRSPGMDKVEKPIESGCSINAGYALVNPRYDNMHAGDSNEELIINTISGHQTLPLFPLQPTGILEGRSADSFTTTSAKDSNPSSSSDTTHPAEEDSGVQPFFDFFSEH